MAGETTIDKNVYCRNVRWACSDYDRIVSKAGIMSAARPATDERAEHLQPLPGANKSMQRTCAPLPQREVVYSSSKPCSLRRRAT